MAITMDLTDPMLVENFKAFQELRSLGIYTDGELQKLYDEQVQKDKERQAPIRNPLYREKRRLCCDEY